MSLPVVLPGSCCRLTGASLAPHFPDSPYRSRDRCMSTVPSRMPGSHSGLIPALLPGRPLLSLGLLQLVLGCSMVALSFGALSLSNSPPIRNSCPFWAGSSVILSGIIGLTTWKRPVLLLVNLFVLLSVVCILLNLAAFILCCQGAQLVSSSGFCQLSDRGNVCSCCSESPSSLCQEEKMLKIQASHSCGAMRILLKKVLFALCALNALTTAVCLIAAALRYLQIFSVRRPCMVEVPNVPEEGEEQTHISDPEEFVPPAPPPSYFSTIYSCTPRLARRMFGDSVIPLPHIYGARIKGVEVFCPLDPPPPYEAVAMETTPIPTQGPEDQGSHPSERFSHLSETDVVTEGRCAAPLTAGTVLATSPGTTPGSSTTTTQGPSTTTTPGSSTTTTQGPSTTTTPGPSTTTTQGPSTTTTPGPSSTTTQGLSSTTTPDPTPDPAIAPTLGRTITPTLGTSPSTSPSTTPAVQLRVAGLTSRKAHRPQPRRSNSDPVLLDLEAKVMSCEAATQTELGPATGARSGAGHASMPATVTLRRGRGPRRPRPSSMVDYQSYRETKLLVAQFLQQSSSCSLTPEVQELIDGITTVLRTDEEHMEDAVHCASLIDQVMSRGGGAAQTAQGKQPRRDCTSSTLPLRKRPGLIHLRSCGDLSTFTWAELQVSSRGSQSGARHLTPGGRHLTPGGRPHSLIGVSRETVI